MQASPLDLPTPPPGPSAAVPALRARAERRMSEQPASAPSPLGHADLHRLLHELQLSQIELEMQNEDLRRIQPELLLARMVFAHCDDGIAVCSPDGRIIDSNPACSRITGHTQAELLGRDARWLAGAATDAAQADARWRCLLSQDHWRGEVQQRRKDGTVFTQRLAIVTVRDDLGDVLHQVAVLSDISQQKQHEAELARIALYDPLTGVPNRRLFADRLDAAMARARPYCGTVYALKAGEHFSGH